MNTRRLASLLFSGLMALALLFIPTMAHAVSPLPSLDGLITDQAGVLGQETGEIEQAQERFHEATGGNFYVVFIDTFGGMNPQQWAYQTGGNAGLQANDVLLVVSPDDLTYQYQHGEGLSFTQTQADALQGVGDNSLNAALEGTTTWQSGVANIIGAFQNEIVANQGSQPEATPGATASPATPGGTANEPTVVAPAPAPAAEASGGLPHWATVLLWILIPLAILGAIIYGYGGYKRKRLEQERINNPLGL